MNNFRLQDNQLRVGVHPAMNAATMRVHALMRRIEL